MKKVLLALMISANCFGQKYIVTPEGLRDSLNLDKTFLVIHFDNVSKTELYNKTVLFLNQKYSNPKKAIKANLKDEYLRVDTFIENFTKVKNGMAKVSVDGEYTIDLKFKDNKIRFQIVNEKFCTSGFCVKYKGSVLSGYPIWNKRKKLKLPKTKKFIEDFFNSEVTELKSFISNKIIKKDDW
jgi:hypothetical protein